MRSILDLEWPPLGEGEVPQVSFLFAPLLPDAAVPDDRLPALVVEARVEVECQVVGRKHIQSNPENQQRPCLYNSSTNLILFFFSLTSGDKPSLRSRTKVPMMLWNEYGFNESAVIVFNLYLFTFSQTVTIKSAEVTVNP